MQHFYKHLFYLSLAYFFVNFSKLCNGYLFLMLSLLILLSKFGYFLVDADVSHVWY